MPGDGGDRIAEVTRAGLAAAIGVARVQGLPADDPEVLSSRGNVLVHLRPAPVVARVATLTAWTRSDPFGWLAREVAVAGYAAGAGGPAVPPTALADPGPHRRDGLAVSLWTFVPPSPRRSGRWAWRTSTRPGTPSGPGPCWPTPWGALWGYEGAILPLCGTRTAWRRGGRRPRIDGP
jgi:hypothetical protein